MLKLAETAAKMYRIRMHILEKQAREEGVRDVEGVSRFAG
jgi:hypothetical protein